jgi:hypothetical protein
MKINKTYYGLFYKSQGRWVGPYADRIGTKLQISKVNKLVKSSLKAKTELRKVKFI